jgi:hypothetical protein
MTAVACYCKRICDAYALYNATGWRGIHVQLCTENVACQRSVEPSLFLSLSLSLTAVGSTAKVSSLLWPRGDVVDPLIHRHEGHGNLLLL